MIYITIHVEKKRKTQNFWKKLIFSVFHIHLTALFQGNIVNESI